MVEAFLCMGGKRVCGKCIKTFSHCTEAKIWYVTIWEVIMKFLASLQRNKPAKLLAFLLNVASSMKLDTKNHIFVKGTSKYCCCKHCGGRTIYLCQKWNVALHPDCFKDFHLWNTKLIVLFSTGSAKNLNPVTIFRKN